MTFYISCTHHIQYFFFSKKNYKIPRNSINKILSFFEACLAMATAPIYIKFYVKYTHFKSACFHETNWSLNEVQFVVCSNVFNPITINVLVRIFNRIKNEFRCARKLAQYIRSWMRNDLYFFSAKNVLCEY